MAAVLLITKAWVKWRHRGKVSSHIMGQLLLRFLLGGILSHLILSFGRKVQIRAQVV